MGRSPRQYQEYVPEGGMYVLYENHEDHHSHDDDHRTRGGRSMNTKLYSITLSPPCADLSSPDPESSLFSPEEESVMTDGRPSSSSHHSRTRDTSNTFIGEIDGRFSFSHAEDYVRVEVGNGVRVEVGNGVRVEVGNGVRVEVGMGSEWR